MSQQEYTIDISSLTVSYQDKIVLEEVNLQVKKGTFLAIVGPNGAGKSTLIKVILGLVKPNQGNVRVFGRSPFESGKTQYFIGYVPQILSIDLSFPISVEDAVTMGRYARIGMFGRITGKDKTAIRGNGEGCGIEDLRARSISRLSGGQLQRVLIARALASEPELLLLDEPTSGVDSSTTFNLYEMLKDLHRENITILLVSHDIGVVASFVDNVACLNRKLYVHGKPGEVLGSEELEKMYGCHAVLFHHGDVPHMVVEKE